MSKPNNFAILHTKTHIFKIGSLLYSILSWPVRSFLSICEFILNCFLDKAKSIFQKIVFLWLIIVVLSSIAVFLYAVFYNFYVPTAEIKKTVHLTFSVCPSGSGVCSFPSGNVTFWNDEGTVLEVLTVGQAYTVDVELEIPDSPANRDLGMFLVVVQMYDRTGHVSLTTQRSVMVKYRSIILRMLDLLLWIPFYFLGILEQKHNILVNMFTHYVDDFIQMDKEEYSNVLLKVNKFVQEFTHLTMNCSCQHLSDLAFSQYYPSVGATVEVYSHKIEIYSTTIIFAAKFSGLKYFLYHWSVISGLCAFIVNVFILIMGIGVAAYQRNETLQKIAAAVQFSDKTNKIEVINENKLVSSSTMTENTKTDESNEDKVKIDQDQLPLIQEPVDFSTENLETDMAYELRYRSVQH